MPPASFGTLQGTIASQKSPLTGFEFGPPLLQSKDFGALSGRCPMWQAAGAAAWNIIKDFPGWPLHPSGMGSRKSALFELPEQ